MNKLGNHFHPSPRRPNTSRSSDSNQREGDLLSEMIRHSNQLRYLEKRLKQALSRLQGEEKEQSHWRIAHLRQGTLLLETASSAWASRLRLQQKLLLNLSAKINRGVNQIEIRVRHTPTPQRNAQLSRPQLLSPEVASALQTMAAGLEESRLRDSLLRIAQRHR
ncbi:MAG: DUF721 domain-containing protein [Gammaproteobacteria bacterium]|nr:DUF721 domain-containing protein [Gammaproteobacteria bacterium]